MRVARFMRLLVYPAALALALGTPAFAQIGFAVTSDPESSDPEDNLFSISLATGVATAIGPTGLDDIEGLAFHPLTGVLYGVDDDTDELVTCNTANGACSSVGGLGTATDDPGLGFACDGTLYMSTEGDDPEDGSLYTVNTTTGAATLIGTFGGEVDGHSIAFGPPTAGCASGAFLLDGNDDEPSLYCVNLANGAATLIGDSGVEIDGQPAIDFDGSGALWLVENDAGLDLYTVSTTSGAASDVGYDMTAGGFDSLAIQNGFCAGQSVVEVPTVSRTGFASLALLLSGLGVWALRRRRAPIAHP